MERPKACAAAVATRGLVAFHILSLGWDVELRKIKPHQPAVLLRATVPSDATERKVRQGMAKRGKLPIQHGNHLRLGGMEEQIAHPIIAVGNGGLIVLGNMRSKPGGELRKLRNLAKADGFPLPRPARDLAGKVVAGLAETFEPHGLPVHIMQA